MYVATDRINRFAVEDIPLKVPVNIDGALAVVFSVGDTSVTVAVVNGTASLPAEAVALLMPDLGSYDLHMDTGDYYGRNFIMERVSARYTDRDRLEAYGQANNDRFGDTARYPDQQVAAAIQQAEETIDRSTGRSFCTRVRTVHVQPRRLVELPMVDVQSTDLDGAEVVNGCQLVGVTAPADVAVTYGTDLDAQIVDAATRLAAWYLRPRAQAENARGTSMDGVYISYDLATGTDGSWTGLPVVDAAIEQHRSRRVVIG